MNNEANTAEWIEALSTAVAALFAIVGVYLAFKSLKKDLSGQQHQIDALIKFTDALDKQTKALKEQNERYMLDIRPYFISGMALSGYGEYTLKYQNDGGDVAILNSVSIQENEYGIMVQPIRNLPVRIPKNSELEIKLIRGGFEGNWNEVKCKIELKFSDKTEINHYEQIISFDRARVSIGSLESCLKK